MNKKEATERISQLVKLAQEKLSQAEKIADEHGITFSFAPSGSYGMGGTYYPDKEHKEEWEPSDTGWVSSSSRC